MEIEDFTTLGNNLLFISTINPPHMKVLESGFHLASGSHSFCRAKMSGGTHLGSGGIPDPGGVRNCMGLSIFVGSRKPP